MPRPTCCYCGTPIQPYQRQRIAHVDTREHAAEYRRRNAMVVLAHAAHVCPVHHRHPPTIPTIQQVGNNLHHI